MKGLDTLIKLHKRALDELRRKIGALENEKAQFIALSRKLEDELQHEIKMAGEQPGMSQFFGGFAKRIKTRQEKITVEVKKLDQAIGKLTEEASAAFGELKKFEIARDRAKKREKKEADRKEVIALDEIAGVQHRRRKKSG